MSKPMTKGKKIVLVILVITVLLAACFGSVGIYAKHELNKPRFTMPEAEPQPSKTALPKGKAAIYAYVKEIYDDTVRAKNAEISTHAEIGLDADLSATTLRAADQDVINFIKDGARGAVAELYPSQDGVNLRDAKDVPAFDVPEDAVLKATAEQGKKNDDGELTDDGFYFITLTADPETVDAEALRDSDVYRAVMEKLADAMTLRIPGITVDSVRYSFKIDRLTDQIVSMDVEKVYKIGAEVSFTGVYIGLGNQMTGWTYTHTQRSTFRWYGANFTARQMVVKKGDMKALPADVRIPENTPNEDFELTFEPSVPDVLSIDPDGVMTVDALCDEPVTVTMTLKYDGETYTDTMTIYITELEVAKNG